MMVSIAPAHWKHVPRKRGTSAPDFSPRGVRSAVRSMRGSLKVTVKGEPIRPFMVGDVVTLSVLVSRGCKTVEFLHPVGLYSPITTIRLVETDDGITIK